MISAFGVDHGDYVEKALNPIKAVKGAVGRSKQKAYQGGYNRGQQQRGAERAAQSGRTTFGAQNAGGSGAGAGLWRKQRKAGWNAGQQRGFASNDVLNRKPDFM